MHHLEDRRQEAGVRDLVAGLPARRHQPSRHAAAVRLRFPDQLRGGWKTSWADGTLIFNGAVFRENWKDFQFSYLDQNGLTEIRNANQARIDGMELDLSWAATYNLQFTGSFAWYDAKLTENYCGWRAGRQAGNRVPGGHGRIRTATSSTWPAGRGRHLVAGDAARGALSARYSFELGSR